MVQQQSWRTAQASVLAGAGFFYAVFIARTSFRFRGTLVFTLFDDPMISMRFARNLARGYGLVWNPGGAHVEGYTNFLWTLWLAALHLLPVRDTLQPLLVMGSGVIILLLAGLAAGSLATRLSGGDRSAGIAAIAATLFYYPLVYWTLRGFEVGLLALLVLLAIILTLRLEANPSTRTWVLLGLVLAAMILTRPDGLLPAAVAVSYLAVTCPRSARPQVIGLALAMVAVFGLQTAWRLAYYGDPLPNTYYLKVAGIPLADRLHRGFNTIVYIAMVELLPLVAVVLAAPRTTWPGLRRGVALVLALVTSQWVYCVYVGGDLAESVTYSDRYLTVVAPALVVAAVVVGTRIMRAGGRARLRLYRVLAGALLLQLVVRALDPRPVTSLQLTPAETEGLAVRVAFPLLGLLVVAALATAERRRADSPRSSRHGPAAASALALGLLLAATTVGRDYVPWVRHNAYLVAFDITLAQNGMELRDATSPNTTIALTAAGAQAYYADRTAIDLLGKSDRVIAHGPDRVPYPYYQPGHAKWNYAYSIGTLRPDLVFGLFSDTDQDRRQIEAWGYQQLGDRVYVRRDSVGVDGVAVRRILRRALDSN
ncbi:MAG: hypothetical protein ACR2MY_05010 [Candidatus Dormibacteria bacterium]